MWAFVSHGHMVFLVGMALWSHLSQWPGVSQDASSHLTCLAVYWELYESLIVDF